MNNDNKSFSYKVGRFLGTAVVVICAACLLAIAIALTMKFILWLL